MFSHGCRIWKEAQRKQLCLIYSKSSNRKLRKCRGLIPAVSSSLSAIVREKKRNSLFRWTHRMLVRIGWSVRLFRTKSGITCNCFTHFWNNRLVFIFFIRTTASAVGIRPKEFPLVGCTGTRKAAFYQNTSFREITTSLQVKASHWGNTVVSING